MHTYTTPQAAALVVLRLILAAVFLYAGYAKLFLWSGTPEGFSGEMAALMKFLTVVEPLGAVAVLAGFLTRWAAAGLAAIMVGAIGVMQFTMQVGFSTPEGAGWNFPLVVLGGCLVLAAFGAGRWSVDATREKGKKVEG